MIKEICDKCLADEAEDRVKAVACFDLGEFCRFFPNGKTILEKHNVKAKMTHLMRQRTSPPKSRRKQLHVTKSS